MVSRGDFNEVTEQNKKYGGNPINNTRVDAFTDCLNYCNLLDLGFKGSRYTWTNKRRNSNTILERLDRVLANNDWLQIYPDTIVQHLPRTYSDHCPILVTLQKHRNPTTKAFRFEKIWSTDPSLVNIIQQSWLHNPPLEEAIQNFKENVTHWNRHSFGNIFLKKRKLLNRIQKSVHYPTSQFLQNIEIKLIT